MSMVVRVLLVAALILSIIVPFGAYFLGEKSRKRYKRSLACNCFFFFGTLALASILSLGGAGSVQAAEAAADVAASGAAAGGLSSGLGYIAPFRYRLRYRGSILRQRGSGSYQRGSEHLR